MKSSLANNERPMTEWLLRVLAVLIYVIAVSNITRELWADPRRWTLVALLITEGYALALILCARRATMRDTSSVAVVATLYSVFYYALFDTGRTTSLIPEMAGVGFYFVGAGWQFAAKLLLGRSFGLLPAQRGVVMSGAYRIVRHPMYLGYLIGQMGFLLVNFSWRNLAVELGVYLALWLRIKREEAVLENSDEYRKYRQRVRWRLVPYVF
jgi:protein-S-isoprenylcysteine O-methyltransferase Ste14